MFIELIGDPARLMNQTPLASVDHSGRRPVSGLLELLNRPLKRHVERVTGRGLDSLPSTRINTDDPQT